MRAGPSPCLMQVKRFTYTDCAATAPGVPASHELQSAMLLKGRRCPAALLLAVLALAHAATNECDPSKTCNVCAACCKASRAAATSRARRRREV